MILKKAIEVEQAYSKVDVNVMININYFEILALEPK